MKRLLLIAVLLFSIWSAYAADITVISKAFSAGNASGFSGLFDTEVDIAVPGTSKKCNASDAVSVLNAFFSNNKPSGFTVVHQADKKDTGFCVAKLPTASNEYRVNVTYRTSGNKIIIQSIRIE